MTDDDRAYQIAGFSAAQIAKFAAARENMNDEDRQAEIDGVRKQLVILPRKPPNVKPPDVDEGPYEDETTKETDMTKQAAATTPKDTINIYSGDDNNNDDEDEEDNNTLHPRTARNQGCENRTDEPLFSDDSKNDHDDNEHDDNYSVSSDDDNNKKKRPRRTPKSTIRTPQENSLVRQPIARRARGGDSYGCDWCEPQRRQVHGVRWIG